MTWRGIVVDDSFRWLWTESRVYAEKSLTKFTPLLYSEYYFTYHNRKVDIISFIIVSFTIQLQLHKPPHIANAVPNAP